MDVSDVKARIEGSVDREAVKALMIDLVAVPSPQTELMEAEPEILSFIREAVEPRLCDIGIDDIRYDAMGNLIARSGRAANGKRLMLISNAMNHPASTMPDPYVGKVIDGTAHDLPGEAVLGRGLCEQKATMSAMLAALGTLKETGLEPEGELIFLCCTSGETGRHDAIRSVVEGEGVSADLAVLGGTSMRIKLGNRGRIDVFVTVHGEPSHSSAPHAGCNAITGAQMVIDNVLAGAKFPEPHPELGACTLTCTHIRSFPDATHTIQERCEMTLDRRLLPGEDPDAVFAEIADLAREVDGAADPASGKTFRVEVELGPFMYPSLVTTDSSIVQLINRSSETMLGTVPETECGASAFDQGYLNHAGIVTCNYGPGEHQFAHTDLDMASVERTADAAKVYAFMVCDYLGVAGG